MEDPNKQAQNFQTTLSVVRVLHSNIHSSSLKQSFQFCIKIFQATISYFKNTKKKELKDNKSTILEQIKSKTFHSSKSSCHYLFQERS